MPGTKCKTFFNWSSGKDSALALGYLLNDNRYEVDYLLTSVNAHHNRVSMHGVRRELLMQQIDAVGIKSGTIELPMQPSNEVYEAIMSKEVKNMRESGFTHAAFGDIFLEDLRTYREQQLRPLGIETLFPLWNRDTKGLIAEFIDTGYKSVVVCVNAEKLDKSFAGRTIDYDFLRDLPADVDPCGENGEFHTFCYYAPYFRNPVNFTIGETVFKEYKSETSAVGFWFCDLNPIIPAADHAR
jgi:uncharacterized protein (TIGR00290 family)